jgi:hypothetical protein
MSRGKRLIAFFLLVFARYSARSASGEREWAVVIRWLAQEHESILSGRRNSEKSARRAGWGPHSLVEVRTPRI